MPHRRRIVWAAALTVKWTTALGALPSVAPVPARVSSTNPLRSLSLDGVNRSNCPEADLRGNAN